jgi:SMC interacting uncharacterized protein involved in chromosome segregation
MSDNHEPHNGAPDQNLAQVRELLFGAQTRDIERQVHSVREELQSNISELKQELTDQLSSLEETIRNELRAARDMITSEQSQREVGLTQLTTTLTDQFTSRTLDISNALQRTENELREHTQKQTQNIWDDLQARYDDLNKRMEHELSSLQQAATPKTALGEMFREMAARLNDVESAVDNS